MKKLAMSLLLATLAQTSFAEVAIDAAACSLNPRNDLGVCLQNKTGVNLGSNNLYLVDNIRYQNGTTAKNRYSLTNFNPDHWISVSLSSDDLKNKKIVSELFSLANDWSSIVSCTINMQSTAHTYPKLSIKYNGKQLYCM